MPAVGPEATAAAEQATVLSAHAALGHEWDLVVIAGLQEGLWPNTIPRGGALGTQPAAGRPGRGRRERVDACTAAG